MVRIAIGGARGLSLSAAGLDPGGLLSSGACARNNPTPNETSPESPRFSISPDYRCSELKLRSPMAPASRRIAMTPTVFLVLRIDWAMQFSPSRSAVRLRWVGSGFSRRLVVAKTPTYKMESARALLRRIAHGRSLWKLAEVSSRVWGPPPDTSRRLRLDSQDREIGTGSSVSRRPSSRPRVTARRGLAILHSE